MARETLLSHVPVDAERVHRIRGEIDPALAAREYEDALLRHIPPSATGSLPRLDLILLGIGTDGHVASLFPDTDILNRDADLVAAVWVPRLASWRISLTLPLINATHRVAVLATGAGKADIVSRVIGDDVSTYPARMVQPASGVDWFLDRAAAAGTERGSRK
jgi:6-phosphogluconolactonase